MNIINPNQDVIEALKDKDIKRANAIIHNPNRIGEDAIKRVALSAIIKLIKIDVNIYSTRG